MNLAWIRTADWFGKWRAIGYAQMAAIAYIPNLIFIWTVTTKGHVDFHCFWTTSRIAINSGAVKAYNLDIQMLAQGGNDFLPFMYPPPFLAIILPLALIPYVWSYIAWVFATFTAYFLTARRLLPVGFWPIAVYPAAFHNAAIGQNAGITAALFCGAALTFRTRPFISGLLLGCFIIKPQLALLFPIAMIAGQHWRVIAGAAVSSLAIILLTLVMFGHQSWLAFMANSGFTRSVLENTPGLWPLITSVYASIRMAGGPLWLAYGCQAALGIVLAVIVWRVWRSPGDAGAKFAILALCTLLTTPYILSYDLVLLIMPICWFAKWGLANGFPPWGKAMLASLYLLPFATLAFSYGIGINIAWCVILAFLLATMKWVGVVRPNPAPAADR